MVQVAQRIEEEFPFLNDLMTVGEHAPSIEQKVEMVQTVRGRSRDRGALVDRCLVERITAMAEAVEGARAAQAKLKQMMDTLVAPPWFRGILDELIDTGAGMRAVVVHNG